MTAAPVRPTAETARARVAVFAVFTVNGLGLATFLSRTPAIRDTLGLSPAQLGLLLLCLSLGSIAGLPLSGPVVARWGAAVTVLAGLLATAAGLGLLAVGVQVAAMGTAAGGFVVLGLGIGVCDVAMNVEGAEVERRLGRSLMPRLHGAFSLGTVTGAGIGVVCAALGLPVVAQLVAVAVVLPVAAAVSTRRFLPHAGGAAGSAAASTPAAWREPRTLVIGLMVLGFAFTEGSANDWIAVAFVDGYRADQTVGAIGYGVFVVAMTAGRFFGGTALERFGRVAMLRVLAGFALAGLLLVLLGGSTPVALAGALLWGIGASLGFPVGMSAAADDPAQAAARVSVVSSVGYVAFLAGPPLIGLLAQHLGILRALFVVVAALALALLSVGAARPRT